MAWTGMERRAFAAAEVYAEASGVIPVGMEGPARAAWVSGYGRGFSGLGAGRLDDEAHRPCRAAWIAGWRAGMAECRDAAQGFSWLNVYISSRASREVHSDFSRLGRPEMDAYTAGYQAGAARMPKAKVELRYRGPLRHLAGFWDVGYDEGSRGNTNPDKVPIPLPGDDGKPVPATGSERQRAYRARHRHRSIDVSADTHAMLRRLCDRDGVGIDDALAAALRTALGETR